MSDINSRTKYILREATRLIVFVLVVFALFAYQALGYHVGAFSYETMAVNDMITLFFACIVYALTAKN